MTITAEQILTALDTADLTFVSEDDLQAELLRALTEHGIPATREHHLSDGRSRIDLWADPIAIEVKIDGGWADVTRQLTRYAHCPEVTELILISTRVKHHAVPSELVGKRVHLFSLIGVGL